MPINYDLHPCPQPKTSRIEMERDLDLNTQIKWPSHYDAESMPVFDAKKRLLGELVDYASYFSHTMGFVSSRAYKALNLAADSISDLERVCAEQEAYAIHRICRLWDNAPDSPAAKKGYLKGAQMMKVFNEAIADGITTSSSEQVIQFSYQVHIAKRMSRIIRRCYRFQNHLISELKAKAKIDDPFQVVYTQSLLDVGIILQRKKVIELARELGALHPNKDEEQYTERVKPFRMG